MSKLIILILVPAVLGLHTLPVKAQEDEVVKDITSSLAENMPEESDWSQFTEQLSAYRRNPIPLNKANATRLKQLFFLSALQINNLIDHIDKNGALADVLELQGIDGFDTETISRMMPFVTVGHGLTAEKLHLGQLLTKGKNELLLRYGQTIEPQKGFGDLPGSRYIGSPPKLLFKYKYNYGNLIAFSLTADKDAGEGLFSRYAKTGFDFISGSLSLSELGRFKKILLGDYSLQFGQGLTLWTGSSFGKGPDVAGVSKRASGLKNYTSTNEFAFFRGIAATYSVLENIDLTAFISLRSLDATLTEDGEGSYTLSTINTSGLHRTPAEISHRGTLGQHTYGAALQMNKPRFDAGFVVYHLQYNHPFVTGEQLYKRYAFYGKNLTNAGLNYSYTFKNMHFFGETAASEPGGLALLNGVMASVNPNLSAVLLHRNYDKDHMNFYSQGLGEGSAAANEKGVYMGIHLKAGNSWNGSFYADIFHFPWARYRIDSASSGFGLMAQLNYTPNKRLKVILKYTFKQNEQNESAELPVNLLLKVYKSGYRMEGSWKPDRKTELGTRVELTRYRKGNSAVGFGYLIYQDLAYHPLSSRMAGNLRIAWFNTSSYENRIYAYEDDVLYGAGSGLYNGTGIRAYTNVNYALTKQLKIWARYSISCYPAEDHISSGLDEINGNIKSEIKLQLRYQF